MASIVQQTQNDGVELIHLYDTFDAAGSTDPVRMAGLMTVQISGTATSITAHFERSVADPNILTNSWAPVDDDPFTGDLSAGIAARRYEDNYPSFYRLRVSAIGGGFVRVSITGSPAS